MIADTALGIRIATRTIVRELGFMHRYLAGTQLTASQAHALLELESRPNLRAAELKQVLRLDKSAVSRLVADLVRRGYIVPQTSAEDARSRQLRLTAAGKQLAKTIQRRAHKQIVEAIEPLSAADRCRILEGLGLYAEALKLLRASPAAAKQRDASNHPTDLQQAQVTRPRGRNGQ